MVQPKDSPPHPFAVGLNGVELSRDHSRLYFNAFTGRHLFELPARDVADPMVPEAKLLSEVSDDGGIGVAGHLALDASGNLYVMDMERNALFRHAPDGTVAQLVSSPMLLWPDTMAVGPDGYLYVTSSQHNRGPGFHGGRDLRQRPFTLYRIRISTGPVRP
jgi:sugar lactone lactonase YvrE